MSTSKMASKSCILGLDPGQSGGAVILYGREVCEALKFPRATDYDICDFLRHWAIGDSGKAIDVAYIEKVHSMPKQGVASSFKFGKNYGLLIGLLTGLSIRYELVTPQRWQKTLGCLSKGDKNVTKAAAQRLWPSVTWTHAIADAALIAEYGRRTEH